MLVTEDQLPRANGMMQTIWSLSGILSPAIAAMMPIMNAHSQTIWQMQTPRELQGRVFAVRRVIAQFTWPLSTAVAGWLGGRFDPGRIIALLGGILVMFCIGQLFNPYLLHVEDKVMLDEMAARAETEPV